MGSGSHKAQDPIKPDAEQAAIAVTLAAEQALLDAAQAAITTLQTEQAKILAGDIEFTSAQDLTNNTAFDLFTIPVPDENGICVEVSACVFADDGTDHMMAHLKAAIVAVNKGGTISATIGELNDDEIFADSSGGGTFTLVFAAAEGADNVLDVSITANTSLTPTTFKVWWQAKVIGSSNGDGLTKVNADA